MLKKISLEDKYNLSCDKVFVTGTQALIRMCLLQSDLDKRNGLKTAGYISGYRGSPLGSIDQQFGIAKSILENSNIIFQPALNEDLAATAIWGTQQSELTGEGTKDGVFAIWYGKGPGVDRSGDVFRHANMAGSSKKGGVIALLGDDHAAESSTSCHQSEFALVDAMMPVLNPSNLEELVNFGLHGWSLSRYSGLWCGIKCVKDNIESTSSAYLPKNKFVTNIPQDFKLPGQGLNIRPRDNRFDQEKRLLRYKLNAAKAYVRENKIDKVVYDTNDAKFGIITTGKAYMDVLQALDDLNINKENINDFKLKVYKIGMSWPLEPIGIKKFVKDLSKVLIVEEKRSLIETQIKEILYNQKKPPLIIGKKDLNDNPLFPEDGTINSMEVAKIIGSHLLENKTINIKSYHEKLHKIETNVAKKINSLSSERTPYFCAGCPHNSSTVLPEGARGYAGIGCHWMVQFMDRNTEGFTHMGGEGANWIGESCFTNRNHVFQNIGDGTFNHSGIMSIRAAIASNVNITFKILYNDAVAMTGGQSHEGGMTSIEIAHQLQPMGIKKLVLVTEDILRHKKSLYPNGMEIFHRSKLQLIQKDLSKISGVTILIYDQTCATEKRRRRKRGLIVDPKEKIFINHEVCEGCGDCGIQSNCVAILPYDTELGRKRKIDQSSCNKDYSCINGFCPSFVTVEGGEIKKPKIVEFKNQIISDPKQIFNQDKVISIVLTGVGGSGVVTVGALIGMAAHIEGKGCGIIDMAGLAQKGGAVTSHIRIANTSDEIKAIRIGPGGADLLIGCDNLSSATSDLLKLINTDGYIVANTNEMFTGDFTRNVDYSFPILEITKRLKSTISKEKITLLDSTKIANTLLGDAIASNLILLGVVWQLGLLPLSKSSIEKAIDLNGIAVKQSKLAFEYGRYFVEKKELVKSLLNKNSVEEPKKLETFDEILKDRYKRLIEYQDKNYALDYYNFLDNVVKYDMFKEKLFSKAVAKNLYKLMAIKDEYEVARLYTNGNFFHNLHQQFDGDFKIKLHLAPPLFSKFDKSLGRPKKIIFSQWIFTILSFLSKIKKIRGTYLDVFSYSKERKLEKSILEEYKKQINSLKNQINSMNYDVAVKIANLPDTIKGYGLIKEKNYFTAKDREVSLIKKLRNTPAQKKLKRALHIKVI